MSHLARSERLLSLLDALRRHRRPVPGRVLAEELGVSLRTLYRDIAALQGQGAVIEGEAGLGYVLRPGFLLPPLMFQEDEVEALVLGARWVAQRTDGALAQAALGALARISAVLPGELQASAEQSGLLVPPGPPVATGAVDVALLRHAIRRQDKLRLIYRDGDGRQTERVVWPLGLGFFETMRMLIAWCELRQDFRRFRADRMETAEPLGQRYPGRRAQLLADWRKAEGLAPPPV